MGKDKQDDCIENETEVARIFIHPLEKYPSIRLELQEESDFQVRKKKNKPLFYKLKN